MLRTESVLTRRKPTEVLAWLFLMLTGVYLLCQCLRNATYVMPAYSFPDRIQYTRILILTAVLVLLKADLSKGWNIRIPFLALTAGVFFMAYRTGRELFLLMIPVLMIGAVGVDYHKILRVYAVVVGSFLLVTLLCSFTGVIPNLVYYQEGHLRSSWGIAYPTDLASFVLFFMMIFWLAWEKLPDGLALIGAAASFLLSWIVAESRTSAICSLIFACLVLLKIIYDRRNRTNHQTGNLERVFHLLLGFSFLAFAAVFFLSLVLYAKGGEPGTTLNQLLSNRLRMTLSIYRDQGIHAFGTNFSQVGLGGNTLYSYDYYFLDSSYPLLLIRYGWVTFLACAALWTGLGLKAWRNRDRKLLYVMAVVAFHALTEHHFLDLPFNILFVLPFAEIPESAGDNGTRQTITERLKENGLTISFMLAGFCVLLLTAGKVLSRLRTVFGIWGVEAAHDEIRAVAWCILLLCAAAGLLTALFLLGRAWRQNRRSAWKSGLLLILSGALLGGMIWMDSRVIQSADESDMLTAEEISALKIMAASAAGDVTAEKLPELACRKVPGVKRTILFGDDLVRMKCISVLLSLEEDRQRFADEDFLFTQISEDKAVYSNDPSVIAAMTENGYEWTDHDAAVRSVDLERLAERNGLICSEEGAILLSDGDFLNQGPDLDLYRGKYRVSFELRTDPGASPHDGTACTLRLTGYGNGSLLAERAVDWNEFDQNGRATAVLEFATPESRMTQFMVLPESDLTLELLGIRYQKVEKEFKKSA